MDGLAPSELQNPKVRAAIGGAGMPAAPVSPPAPPAVDIDQALGLPPRAAGLAAPDDIPADFGDVFGAAWTKETIATDAWGYADSARRDLTLEMFDVLPADAKARINDQRLDRANNWMRFEDMVAREMQALAQTGPEGAMLAGRYPQNADQFDQRINEQLRAEYDQADAVLGRDGGGVAEFLGAGARAMTDQVSLAMLPFGGSTAKGVLRFAAVEAGLGGLGELAVEPRRFAVANELDLPDPNVVADVSMGAVFGGAFGAMVAGAPKAWEGGKRVLAYAEARRAPAQAAARAGEDLLDADAAVDAAEAQMRGDTTLAEELPPSTAETPLADALARPALPEIGPDAPPNWEQIRNGIFVGESGGDFNALFGFTNRKGGRFSRIKLTEMTVDQAIEFSRPDGEYGQWVKSRIGKVSTPMGAYQIVGKTLREVKRGFGLQGDEMMTPELQERMGQWIYRQQGTGAWEGYKGPRDTFSAFDPSAPAPDFGPTARGYTGAGQVSTADGMRIDVTYEVVDLSSLIRASGDLQPRDRSRGTSDAWIADTAARLDPAQLMQSPTADRGAPIVGPDNVIESGNGRFGAIQRAYTLHPDRATAYRTMIEQAGYDIPADVQRPILIARRTSDMSPDQRKQFVISAQDSGVAAMNATETARAFATALSPDVLLRFNPNVPLGDADNGDFLRAALTNLSRSARNAMFDASGYLNRQGERQLREAMFARAWTDADIIEMFAEADAGDLRGLMDALADAVPEWAALKADIEAGLVRPEMDISGYVTDAMRLIATARRMTRTEDKMPMAKAIAELLDEVDLLSGPVAPLTVAMVNKFWTNGRAASTDKVATFLTRYASDARKAGVTGSFLDDATPRDVLRAIDGDTFADLPENLGPVRGYARPGAATTPLPDLPEEGFDTGAASAEAAELDEVIRDDIVTASNQPFGPVFTDIVDDPEAAIKRLMAEQTGEAPNAVSRQDIGPIALVYGRAGDATKDYAGGFGLAHIQAKHPEVMEKLPSLLRDGRLLDDPDGQPRKYILAGDDPATVAVVRMDWDGNAKQWLVTAFNDDIGKFARDQKEAYRDGLTSTRVPVLSEQNDDAIIQVINQDRADLATMRDGITAEAAAGDDAAFANIKMRLDDGTEVTVRDMLDDLDADAEADANLQLCPAGRDAT